MHELIYSGMCNSLQILEVYLKKKSQASSLRVQENIFITLKPITS